MKWLIRYLNNWKTRLSFADSMATATASPLPEPPLRGFQILLIICAILFLSLLLLGLGCSYMCLKRRNVRVIHRHPFGSGSGSEITKLSTSSLSNITMFEGLKIPRAHALLHAPPSTTGSDANLMIDHSLPSDYPSESSEVSLPIKFTTIFICLAKGKPYRAVSVHIL